MHCIKGFCFFLLMIVWQLPSAAQHTTLTIDSCYSLARQNYPLIRKYDLIRSSGDYLIRNVSKLYLPQLTLGGQASYQSETIHFPDALSGGPGAAFPELSKDQYRVQAELVQQVYDGGAGKLLKASGEAETAILEQRLEKDLYALRERVTEICFAILLMDEQLKQNGIRRSDLEGALNRATGAYENGTAFKADVDELKAELVSAGMVTTELQAGREAYGRMLGLLTGKKATDSLRLAMPEPWWQPGVIRRPELSLFELQKKSYTIREKQLKVDYTPKLSAFVQAAYGRPTLNILENKWGPWLIGGLRLNWSFGGLYTLKNNKNILANNRQLLEIDKETFLFNTNLSLMEQDGEVRKYKALVKQDEEAIALRVAVKRSAEAQWENGVITPHDFIMQVNAENQARQLKILHTIQLLHAQYRYRYMQGD